MNAHAERFNRTIQESFVDYHEELLFTDLALFNRKLANWLVFYNAERPHHSLGQQSPLSFLLKHQPECQRYWTHTTPCYSAPGLV
jgi:transposase InsO family protein